ncbi:MAG: FeoA family protein [Verrucomicrobiota bacterium]|jgi:Fe2+ transport system protein FeoA|nr:FeoA family protein [Verrucomicrobiota bacterium]
MSDQKSLGQLAIGESAILGEMTLPEAASMRLQEMGLLPGSPIRLIRRAPLGCPLEFEVAGSRLAIRGADASNIFIQ